MVCGVGIDLVCISDLEALVQNMESAFALRTFTERERAYASQKYRPCESLAGMFAVKEAVTKAVCTLAPDEWIDLRRIETLHDQNGKPYVAMEGPLGDYLELVGVARVCVSITNEGDYAAAVAVAER